MKICFLAVLLAFATSAFGQVSQCIYRPEPRLERRMAQIALTPRQSLSLTQVQTGETIPSKSVPAASSTCAEPPQLRTARRD